MQYMTLKVSSLNHPPYVILNETRKGLFDITGGIDAYIINILKEKFSFKYEAVMPLEKEWGRIHEGRWTGVIGMVYRNEVDFGISNMMINENRYDSVALSIPYNSDGWVLVSLAPRFYENKHAFVHPFTKEVWCALFVSILISSSFLFSLHIIRSHFKRTPKITWRNTLWNVVAALCQEGVKLSQMQASALAYFMVWIYASMILRISYGGLLIGFLTFPTKEASIETLEDLANAIQSKGINLCLKKYSSAHKLLESHETYGDIFTKSLLSDPRNTVSSHVEGFQGVFERNFVFIGNEFGCIYDSYLVDFSKLQMISVLTRSYVSIAFSRKFQYVKDFNTVLRRMTERGLIIKWRSDLLTRRLIETVFKEKKNKIEEKDMSESKSLKIQQLEGAFMLLVFGDTLAVSALIFEIFYAKQFTSKQRKQRHSHK